MTCPAPVSHWFGRPCSASTPLASRSPPGSLASRSRGYAGAVGLMLTRGKVHISGAAKGTRERFAAASLRRIFLARAHPPRGDFRQRGAVRHHERPRPALHLLSTMPLPPIRGRCRHRARRRRAGRSARAARPSPRCLHPPRTFPPQRQPMRYGFGGSGVREFGSSGGARPCRDIVRHPGGEAKTACAPPTAADGLDLSALLPFAADKGARAVNFSA